MLVRGARRSCAPVWHQASDDTYSLWEVVQYTFSAGRFYFPNANLKIFH